MSRVNEKTRVLEYSQVREHARLWLRQQAARRRRCERNGLISFLYLELPALSQLDMGRPFEWADKLAPVKPEAKLVSARETSHI